MREALVDQIAAFGGAPLSRISKLSASLRRDWLRALLLLIIGIGVRSPALQGQRIWDDQYLSHDHPFIKSPLLILETFQHYLFLDSFSAHYRPVQILSYMADYFFWNTNEFGFHLTNTLLHAGGGVLLYFLLQKLFASLCLPSAPLPVQNQLPRRVPWISHSAFLIALLWVVHPVHSAAVDYVSGRADSLAFFFAAAGWLCFLRAECIARPFVRISCYGLSALFGFLALFSREIACVWLFLFLAHLLFKKRPASLRIRVGATACCVGLIALYIGLRQLPERRLSSPSQAGWRAPVRAVLMTRALGDYGRLLILPTNLHMERTVFDPMSCRSNVDWRKTIGVEYLSILGLVLLAGFVFGSVKKGRGQSARIFGATWFFAAYLPISNIVQLNATVAEHWLYLPSVGFLIFLFGWVVELPMRYRHLVVWLALFATIGLSVRSFSRSGDWADEETFYKRTLAAGSTSGRVAVNLAQIYLRRGDDSTAEQMFRRVLQSTPDYPIARNNLASLLYRQGKKAEAETILRSTAAATPQTRKEYPRTWVVALSLARLRHDAKDDKEALTILEKARVDYPDVWEIVSFESELIRKSQGPEAALRLVEAFARDNWWHYGAALALGRLYAESDDINRADAALSHASWLDLHDAEALHLIALIKLRQNHLDEAFRAQRRAISRQPDQPSQYILLSNILEKMGRTDEARAALAQVSRLRALANNQTLIN
jgi:tetratricopeptide (TPR) repeat protein